MCNSLDNKVLAAAQIGTCVRSGHDRALPPLWFDLAVDLTLDAAVRGRPPDRRLPAGMPRREFLVEDGAELWFSSRGALGERPISRLAAVFSTPRA